MTPLNAIALTKTKDGLFLTQKEAVELAQQIEYYKNQISHLSKLKDMLENELYTERKLNKVQIQKLKDTINQLDKQIGNYKELINSYKEKISRLKIKNKIDLWVNRISFLILGFLIGQVVNH